MWDSMFWGSGQYKLCQGQGLDGLFSNPTSSYETLRARHAGAPHMRASHRLAGSPKYPKPEKNNLSTRYLGYKDHCYGYLEGPGYFFGKEKKRYPAQFGNACISKP